MVAEHWFFTWLCFGNIIGSRGVTAGSLGPRKKNSSQFLRDGDRVRSLRIKRATRRREGVAVSGESDNRTGASVLKRELCWIRSTTNILLA